MQKNQKPNFKILKLFLLVKRFYGYFKINNCFLSPNPISVTMPQNPKGRGF